MLKNKLCTLVKGLGEKLSQKRWKPMNQMIRIWDREPSSLSSHALTSFYIDFFKIHISYVKVT